MPRSPLPRRYLMPSFFATLGLGLCGWYGLALYELPRYSEQDIALSADANLAMDLSRMGEHLRPDAAGVQRLRVQVEQEVRAEIAREREAPQQGIAMGLLCLVAGLGSFAFARYGASPPA